MNKIVVLGAGGHSRSVIANLQRNQFTIRAIYDDGFKVPEKILGIDLVGTSRDIPTYVQVVLAIGNNSIRKKLFEKFQSQMCRDNILHPSAQREEHVLMGISNLVFANGYINNGAELGDNNLINTSAIIEHEVKIGSHNHISVGATLLGRSQMGDLCFVGANATIKDGVKIGSNITIGAHSFVAEDIMEPGTYVGSPARKVK